MRIHTELWSGGGDFMYSPIHMCKALQEIAQQNVVEITCHAAKPACIGHPPPIIFEDDDKDDDESMTLQKYI